MLTLINAQERSATEFRTLFAAASPGYKFLGVSRPKGCRMSIIEAVWEGEDYGLESPTPADTPLVTPVDSPIEPKREQDKSLPLPTPALKQEDEAMEKVGEKQEPQILDSKVEETKLEPASKEVDDPLA